MYLKCLLFISVLVFLPVAAFGYYDCSDPDNCAVTCDGTNDTIDINLAIIKANTDSTVTIGAGTCGISGTVSVNKAITLAGAGEPSWTVFSGSASPMIDVTHNSGFARVRGIKTTNNVNKFIQLSGTILYSDSPKSGVRIDNNYCENSYHCVFSNGRVEGVVDSNKFVNCDRCVYDNGNDDSAWDVGFDPYNGGSGTGNYLAGINNPYMLFFEDNEFERNSSHTGSDEQPHYTQTGARTVFRYNTVDMSTWSFSGAVSHDSHGNQKYYNEAGSFRGQPIHEIYNNTWLIHTTRGNGQTFDLRSGSNIIFNNTIIITNPGDATGIIEFWEEEAESGSGRHFTDPGFDYVWPTEDMVTNSFVWNNTINGSALTKNHIDGNTAAACCGDYPDASSVINFERDVWMHEPQSTGGRTYYSGRPGASGRDTDGTLVFKASGANAYYPYTPYTYPHPLRTSSASPLPPLRPPTNFRRLP